MSTTHAIILIGVSGAGKTTIGRMLAERLGWRFIDADDFHSPAHIAKMSQGIALNDKDRMPWLRRLRREVIDPALEGNPIILACSALKAAYREILGLGEPGVVGIFLDVDSATLTERLATRSNHYMKADLLGSQLATLEIPSPDEAIHISCQGNPSVITEKIVAALSLT